MTTTSTAKKVKFRVIDNWKSSLAGLLIAAICFVLLWKKIADWDQVIGFLTLSGCAAWVKDTFFKP